MPTDEILQTPIEVRTVDEPLRRALMVVCRYGETSRRLPKPERFLPGAFTRSVTERGPKIPFTRAHTGGTGNLDRRFVVGRPVEWRTADLDLLALLQFFDTPDGWAAFCDAKDGKLTGGSVGFRAIEEREGADGAREVAEAMLHHVCITGGGQVPAYDEPRLVEVRAAERAETAKRLLAVSWPAELAERASLADQLANLAVTEQD